MTDEKRIDITSGVSHRTGHGFVELHWGTESGQLTPTETRLHALRLLEAADAAESDAFIVGWMREHVHGSDEAIGQMQLSRSH